MSFDSRFFFGRLSQFLIGFQLFTMHIITPDVLLPVQPVQEIFHIHPTDN